MKVGELFVQLGVLADSKTLKDFAKGISDIPLSVAGGIASLIGLEYQLTKLTQEAMATAIGFNVFTSQTGLSWRELQKWQIVAEQANVSAETVASSVSALERNMAEIRLGRGNVSPFQLLGIGVNQNAFGVLQQLRERIRGMDRPTAVNLISQMGLSPDMIQVLQLSDREFAKLSKTIHGLTTEQEKDLLTFKQQLVQLGMVAKEVSFDFIGHLVHAFELILSHIKNIPVHMPTLIASIALLGVALFPVQAAIVALLLLLDDLAVYFSGGDSMIGDAVKGLKELFDQFKGAPMQTLSKMMNLLQPGQLGVIGLPAQAIAGAAGNKSVQNVFNMTIHGTGPAEAIAHEVTRQIGRHFGKAEQQVNNQGR